eukprot:1975430-Rhodomonas_salina.1
MAVDSPCARSNDQRSGILSAPYARSVPVIPSQARRLIQASQEYHTPDPNQKYHSIRINTEQSGCTWLQVRFSLRHHPGAPYATSAWSIAHHTRGQTLDNTLCQHE